MKKQLPVCMLLTTLLFLIGCLLSFYLITPANEAELSLDRFYEENSDVSGTKLMERMQEKIQELHPHSAGLSLEEAILQKKKDALIALLQTELSAYNNMYDTYLLVTGTQEYIPEEHVLQLDLTREREYRSLKEPVWYHRKYVDDFLSISSIPFGPVLAVIFGCLFFGDVMVSGSYKQEWVYSGGRRQSRMRHLDIAGSLLVLYTLFFCCQLGISGMYRLKGYFSSPCWISLTSAVLKPVSGSLLCLVVRVWLLGILNTIIYYAITYFFLVLFRQRRRTILMLIGLTAVFYYLSRILLMFRMACLHAGYCPPVRILVNERILFGSFHTVHLTILVGLILSIGFSVAAYLLQKKRRSDFR